MSLFALWQTESTQIREKHVQQLISFAGEGQLKDGGKSSNEFRELLANVPTVYLRRYADQCLRGKFDGSGFALQDVINETGRRLGFDVRFGRYRGVQNEVGADGVWHAPEGNTLVVEVKTTDAYRIHLDTIAAYRSSLLAKGQLAEDSSILLVVGRQDTGDLEAQIRGSKHAWDVRIISVDALLRLLSLKEELDDAEVEARVRRILVPREYTRVDEIIELAFSTTADAKEHSELILEIEDNALTGKSIPDVNDGEQTTPTNFNDLSVERVSKHLGIALVKRSRTFYSSADGQHALICAVSKEYRDGPAPEYWFAFHPHSIDKLSSASSAYVAFGCGSPGKTVLLPFRVFKPWLDGMNTTKRPDGSNYWHVHIFDEKGKLALHRKAGTDWPDITAYLLPIKLTIA